MKGNTPGFLLLGLTLVSALYTAYLSWATIQAMNVQHGVSAQLESVMTRRTEAAALIADIREYSKKNPAIIPVMKQIGLTTETPAAK